MKRNYLLSIIVIGLIVLSLYSTYAMFTSSVETNDIISMDSVMNYTFKINGTQNLKVSANSKLRFNAIVENDMKDKISYGLYYKMINPEILPEGVVIAEVTDADILTTKGTINENSQIIVPLEIRNTTSEEVTIEIGLATGYATETQGVDQLIYSNGQIPITEKISPEEVGDDSCSSTMECTEECISKKVDNNWVKFCYCNTGQLSEPLATSYIESLLDNNYETMNNDDPDGNIRYMGKNPNNYVKFNDELWRIIGVFKVPSKANDSANKRLKIIRNQSVGYLQWDRNGKNNWATASLQSYLNTDYLLSLDIKYSNMIDDALWSICGSKNYNDVTTSMFYERERGDSVYNGWIGKIGLMYPSDYGYATSGGPTTNRDKCLTKELYGWYDSNYSDCKNNNYLYKTGFHSIWTLTHMSNSNEEVFGIDSDGRINYGYAIGSSGVGAFPVTYLKSTVKIIGGEGTESNPYQLSL